MKKIGVALLGLGVVGGGTYKILTEKREYIRQNDGVDIEVRCVVEKNLEVGGVVMTMYDSRTNLSKQVLKEVRQYMGSLVFNTLIPRTVRLAEAPSFGKTIFEYARWNEGAFAYDKLAKEVHKRFFP